MPPPPKQHPAIQLLSNHHERFTHQGSITATWRTYRDRQLGPYYRLVWRDDGRQRTLYLGRQGPLVDEVRRLLGIIQAPVRFQRAVRHRRARFRREVLRPLKRYLDETFLIYGGGLYLKGYELRGRHARAGKLPPLRLPACGFSDSSSRLPSSLRNEGSRHRPIPPPLPGTVPAGPPPEFPFPQIAPIRELLSPTLEQREEDQHQPSTPSARSNQPTPSDPKRPKQETDSPKAKSRGRWLMPQESGGDATSEPAVQLRQHCATTSSLRSPVSSLVPLMAHSSKLPCLENRQFVTQNFPHPRGPPSSPHLRQTLPPTPNTASGLESPFSIRRRPEHQPCATAYSLAV